MPRRLHALAIPCLTLLFGSSACDSSPPARAEADTAAKPNAEAKADAKPEADAKPKSDAEPKPEAKAEADPAAKPSPEPNKPRATEARCKVAAGGAIYDDPCKFTFAGDGKGSFSIEALAKSSFDGAELLTVTVTEEGVAEVRGLTSEGINSRWGEAKRSTKDKACWAGGKFTICVYAAVTATP